MGGIKGEKRSVFRTFPFTFYKQLLFQHSSIDPLYTRDGRSFAFFTKRNPEAAWPV